MNDKDIAKFKEKNARFHYKKGGYSKTEQTLMLKTAKEIYQLMETKKLPFSFKINTITKVNILLLNNLEKEDLLSCLENMKDFTQTMIEAAKLL